MNSLEQATKAIFDELHNDGCPFEDSERLAIIAKHLDAFGRDRERAKSIGRVIEHIEAICKNCGHMTTEDGCAFCIKEQNRELLKEKKVVDWLEANLHKCAIGHPTREGGSWWIFFDDETHDLSGETLREVASKAINPQAPLPNILLTLNEKKLTLPGGSKVCEIRAKLPPECAGYSIYREKSPMPDEQLTDIMPLFDGDKLYSVPPACFAGEALDKAALAKGDI